MTEEQVDLVAKAMEARRRDLIAHPLASIWKDLARVAIEATQPFKGAGAAMIAQIPESAWGDWNESEVNPNAGRGCWCWKCTRGSSRFASRMILCPKCGNKRCPHASDHALACTGSNEPGQPGSVY